MNLSIDGRFVRRARGVVLDAMRDTMFVDLGRDRTTRTLLQRGRQLSLADGKRLWRFNTIPSPGEPGGDTWPAGHFERGGRATSHKISGRISGAKKTLRWAMPAIVRSPSGMPEGCGGR